MKTEKGSYVVVAVVSSTGNLFLSGHEDWCKEGSWLIKLVNHARTHDT